MVYVLQHGSVLCCYDIKAMLKVAHQVLLTAASCQIATAKEPPPIPDFSNPALRDLALRCLEVEYADRPHSSDLLKHSLWQNS